MDQEEFIKFVDLIMSMSLDYKLGKLSQETFTSNLTMIAEQMILNKTEERIDELQTKRETF